MYYCQNKEEPLKVDVVIKEVILPWHLDDVGPSEGTNNNGTYVGYMIVNILELQNRD